MSRGSKVEGRRDVVVKERIVYSSDKGRICAKCGWPATDCKKVTVIHGVPKNAAFLESLAKELKKSCGAGGKAGVDFVELQGDQRDRLRDLLAKQGWTVKG